jgi:hypothetical protein
MKKVTISTRGMGKISVGSYLLKRNYYLERIKKGEK